MTDSDPMVLEDALEKLRKNSDVLGQLQILIQLGQFYQSKRRYQKALIYSRQALDLVKDQSNPNPNHRIVALVNNRMRLLGDVTIKKSYGLLS